METFQMVQLILSSHLSHMVTFFSLTKNVLLVFSSE